MKNKSISILTFLLLSATPLLAQPKPSEIESFFSNPLLIILSGIALILLFVIYVMAKVALMTIKKSSEKSKKSANKIASAIGTIVFMLSGSSLWALSPSKEGPSDPSGISASITNEALWASLCVIAVEVLIIAYLYGVIRRFSGMQSAKKTSDRWAKIWASWQKSTPIENEGDIDLGHNYDGIRELDNPTPPWWRWAFVATMVFGVIYMYRYHIAKTAPLQIEELNIAMAKGEADKKEFLANSPNAFNETNIKMMEDGIGPGAVIFTKNCVACHGATGEGNAVGPNLTDAYWLHGGGIKNIFKTVKYGYPEKGMKAWQDDLSSMEIAQVSSYLNSIVGSNPPNAKEAQGELWKAEGAPEGADATEEGDKETSSEETEEKKPKSH